MTTLKYTINKPINQSHPYPDFTLQTATQAKTYHESIPNYKATPLVHLNHLAKDFGVKNIMVKDESHRLGLNAFKALGASYAVGKVVEKTLMTEGTPLNFSSVQKAIAADYEKTGKKMTFITATDGNHGRGLAWMANQLGSECVVLMPKGSSLERLENIQKEGANAYITEWNYDDAVREAQRLAAENGWHLVQDTVLEDYVDIPKWIMQGYMTLGLEVLEQLKMLPEEAPITHIFLQAGVGSMASAMAALFVQTLESPPKIIIVEPDQADCFYKTALANDGVLHLVQGDMNTIMAGLACGEPNPIAWDILKHYGNVFISCSDQVSALGMRILASPLESDARVIAGESGAVGLGVLYEIMKNPDYIELRYKLALDENAYVLLINTEGATDTVMYREIVWEGKYPRCV